MIYEVVDMGGRAVAGHATRQDAERDASLRNMASDHNSYHVRVQYGR